MHAKPYDAPARGKMERFWRTLRAGCLDHLGEMSALHEVNVRLYAFVDQHYHRAPHASLMGRTPEEVWQARAAERQADALGDDTLRAALTVRARRRTIGPLAPADTAAYVRARLELIGCTRELFAADALAMLHEATRGATCGAMRDIDRVATAALRHAARGKHRLVERDVLDRVLDLDERDP